MEIRVSGHQVDTGEALQRHCRERLAGIADKYFERALSARVTFGKGPHDHAFTCDIVAHVMQDVILKGSGRGQEAHPAFDQAADRIEKQLKRYLSRLKTRHGRPPQAEPAAGADGEAEAEAGYTVFAVPAEDEPPAEHPAIVVETRVDIPDATVIDAVMLLDLRNTNALLFRNSGTGRFNMVYRRQDGTVGWVEPQRD